MLYGPDISSGEDEDGYFADDPEYELYKEKLRKNRYANEVDKDDDLKKIFINITSGNDDEVIRLLNNIPDKKVDVGLENGWTPFLLASSLGKPQLVKELINRGANISSTKDGLNALMLACDSPKDSPAFQYVIDVIQILIESGINIDAIDRKRRTGLMLAAYNGNLDAVRFLMPLCNRNAEDNQKWTALFWAVYGNHPELVKYLLDEGFSIEHHDVRDFTPLELAKENGLEEVAKLFPNDEVDDMFPLPELHGTDFNLCFATLKPNELPSFFLDIYSILHGTKNQALAQLFAEKNISLRTFLALTDLELEHLGVQLPFQRARIIVGLYRLHQHKFNPNSIPFVERNELYSNLDACQAFISALKQFIVMDSSLNFMLKNNSYLATDLDGEYIEKQIKQTRKKIKKLKAVIHRLFKKTEIWDDQNQPVDIISCTSRRRKLPWLKLAICSFGIVSSVLITFRAVNCK